MFTGLQGWVDGIRELLDVDTPEYTDDRIKQFLFAGEVVLNRRIRTIKTERHIFTTVANDTCGQVLLPDDYGQMRSVHSEATGQLVELSSPDEFYNHRRYFSGDSIYPEVCMIVGHVLHLFPEAAGGIISLIYYATVPHLVDHPSEVAADQVTDFTEFYPDALLYASVLNAAPYMLDDVRLPIWKAELDRILSEVAHTKQSEHYGSSPIKRRLRVMGR